MSKIVFATVGTSAVENCVRDWSPKKPDSESWTEYLAKLLEEEATRDKVWNRLLQENASTPQDQSESIIHNMNTGLEVFKKSIGGENMAKDGRLVSAEVASLLLMSKQKLVAGFDNNDQIWLMPSDTPIGQVCADANKTVLRKLFPQAVVDCTKPIKGVKFSVKTIQEKEIFSSFLKDGLADFENEIKVRTSDRTGQCILDITGGFKGLVFFAPLLCTRHLVDVVYYYYQEAAIPAKFLKGEVIARIQNADIPISYTDEALCEALE